MPYGFIDPLWVFIMLPAILLALYGQVRVRSAYGKYVGEPNARGLSGAQAARRLLDAAGLTHVPIEEVPGELGDHYDPRRQVLRLSPQVFSSPSVAALGIAAHEVGHAVQDHTGYTPMRVRAGLVPFANIGSSLVWVLLLLGFLLQIAGLVWLGVFLFASVVLFTLVTLPVEYNASSRALQMLRTSGMVSTWDFQGTKAVLDAAALTYVAALFSAIGQLLYFVLMAAGMGNRDD